MTSYLPPAQSLFSSQQLLQQAVPIGPEPPPGHPSPPYPTRRHFRQRLPPTLLMPLNAFPQPSGANESLVGGEEATTSSMPQLVRVVEGRMGEALDGASELLVAPLDCGSVGVPSSQDFFRRLDPVTLWLVAGSAVCGALTLLLFALHIRTITRYIHCPRRRMLYGWMAGVFPVTAVGSLVGAGVPRALPLCDVLIQSYFGLCALFAFAELIQSFLGGELEAPKALRGQAIHLASPPLCCCLPRVLPPLKPSRQNLFRLNALICQAGVVRPLVQFAKGVMWAERMADVTPASTPVLLVLSVVSTMSAMWGLMVLYRLVAPAVPELRPMGLIRLTQILLILFGFQTGAFSLLASPLLGSLVGCDGALPGVSRAALWAHLLLVLEMGLLSAVATLLLRPSRNAVFDLHPCQWPGPHNADRRLFGAARPEISEPRLLVPARLAAVARTIRHCPHPPHRPGLPLPPEDLKTPAHTGEGDGPCEESFSHVHLYNPPQHHCAVTNRPSPPALWTAQCVANGSDAAMLMTPIRLGSNVYTLKDILRLSTVGLCGFVFIIYLMCQKRSSRTVREIRRQLVPPNPSLRYNLTQPEKRDFSQYQEMGAFVQKIFGDKRSGVFLEAGAFDGERYSNSLQVERERGWTGLLIEPLEDNFAKLRSKNRQATLLNACVDSVRGRKVKVLTGPGEYATSHEAEMVENRNPFVFHKADALVKHSVVCYNIQDILVAASLRHIDWLILDLEGGEQKVLQAFPWHTVSVDVVQIECCFNVRTAVEDEELETWYREFLASKGYSQVFRSRLDLMFRRRA